jgi:WD40 repeat protein
MVLCGCGIVSVDLLLGLFFVLMGDHVREVRTGQSVRALLGHTGPVTCLQFDEIHVVSGSLDKTMRVSNASTFCLLGLVSLTALCPDLGYPGG